MDILEKGLRQLVVEGQEVVEDVKREVVSLVRCSDEHAEEVHQVARNVKNYLGDQVDSVHGAVICGIRELLYPEAIGEDPVAEIRLRHPIIGQMVSLGCKLSVTMNGHVIHNIQSDSMADKLNLKENDILFKIDEEQVKMWPLGKVIQFLAEREVTFTLVIKRKKPNSDDEYVFIAIRVKISIEGDTIEAQITGRFYIKPSPVYGSDVELTVTGASFDVYVYQDSAYESSKFLNIQDDEPYVTTISDSVDDLYKFRAYQLQGWDRTAFIISNETVNQAIHAPGPRGYASLTDEDNKDLADGFQNVKNSDIYADSRMFYTDASTSYPGYKQYESVIHRGSYLAAENGRLVLVKNPGGNISKTLFKMVRTDMLNPTDPQKERPKPSKPNLIHK